MALLTELKLIPADSFPSVCKRVTMCACARSYKDASDRFRRMISRWLKRVTRYEGIRNEFDSNEELFSALQLLRFPFLFSFLYV